MYIFFELILVSVGLCYHLVTSAASGGTVNKKKVIFIQLGINKNNFFFFLIYKSMN